MTGSAAGDASGSRVHRVIVKVDPSAVEQEALTSLANDLADSVDGSVVRISPSGRVLLDLPPSTDAVEAAAELSRRTEVLYAEPDVIDQAQPES